MVFSTPPATVPPVALEPASRVAASNPAPHGWTSYKVRPGDTLIGIAARFRTTVDAIAARNHIRNRHHILAGSVLSVPRTSAPASSASRVAVPARVHVVRSGETLGGIAARYNVSLPALLKANHLSARSFIQPGQRVVVRAAGSKAAAPHSTAATTAYRVRAGDTLGAIALRHHTSVARIARASKISSRALIHPGQVLRVPGRAKASTKSSVPDTFNGVKYPQAVARAAAHNRAILAGRSVPSRSETRALIVRIARQQGVDPRLALAIAYQESGWNQRAVSPANAVGVMQVIPQSGQWASSLVGRRLDLLRTKDNITAGVVMLRALGHSTNSTKKTVAAYYQGLGALQQHGMYDDTKLYVRNVLALRRTM
jgi:LysM repeat protein